MKEECLICREPLVYSENDERMECMICHKKENSKTKCVNGHYVCNECHTKGMDTIISLGFKESSKNPIVSFHDFSIFGENWKSWRPPVL